MGFMKHGRWLAVFLIGTGWVSEASGQFFLGPAPVGFGNITIGRGVDLVRPGRPVVVSGYFSRWSRLGCYPYWPHGSRVTVFYYASPVVVNPAPPVVDSQPPVEENVGDDKLVIVPRRWQQAEKGQPDQPPPRVEPLEPPLPGDPASVFRPIRPQDRAPARQPIEPERPAPRPPQPRPGANGLDDKDRLAVPGLEAFRRGEYARAERRWQQATVALADEPRNYFLLAQAQMAQGKYQEAVASIHAGLRRDPDWPRARFRPGDLYGPDAPDFPNHLQQLQEALERFPNDPVLLFLFGCQLWFDGRQEEAREFFERAAKVALDRTFIDRFLEARPGKPVAQAKPS
jgi:hypothetical protein